MDLEQEGVEHDHEVGGAPPTIAVAIVAGIGLDGGDHRQETREPVCRQRSADRLGVATAGLGESERVVRVPVADVLQAEGALQFSALVRHERRILEERRGFVPGPRAGAQHELYRRRAAVRPESEQIPASLPPRVLGHEARQGIQVGLVDGDPEVVAPRGHQTHVVASEPASAVKMLVATPTSLSPQARQSGRRPILAPNQRSTAGRLNVYPIGG